MKNILFALFFFYGLQVSAQQATPKQLMTYVEYADSVTEYRKTTKLVAGNVRMWFNDTVSYQQYWLPLPTVEIAPTKGRPTANDRLFAANYKKQFAINHYAQKVNVCKIDVSDKDKRMYINYDINPGHAVAYFSPNVPQDHITFVEGKYKTILGLPCKLALFHVTNENGQSEAIKIWYTPQIRQSFGPERFAQQLPGMVLKVESSLHNYTAIKLDTQAGEMPNFDWETKKEERYSYEEVKVMFKKRYEEYLQASAKK